VKIERSRSGSYTGRLEARSSSARQSDAQALGDEREDFVVQSVDPGAKLADLVRTGHGRDRVVLFSAAVTSR
jgi:hypothetical protein